MEIKIVAGTGMGPTKLAAFDAALLDAGVANYNLIRLSSIIPPKARIIVRNRISTPQGDWGKKLYVVMADEREDSPNVEAWAGIGWVQDPKTGKGLFVEHVGASESAVRKDITDSLQALMRGRNMRTNAKIQMKVAGITCDKKPVCALVIAVYQAEGWHPLAQ